LKTLKNIFDGDRKYSTILKNKSLVPSCLGGNHFHMSPGVAAAS